MPRLSIDEALKKETQAGTGVVREGFDVASFQSSLEENVIAPQTGRESGGFMKGVENFLGGAVEGFSGLGRGLQDVLPKGIATVPQRGGAQTGAEMGREARLRSIGADPRALSTKFGEFGGEAATFAAPGGFAAKATTKAPLLAKMLGQGATSFGVETARQGEVTPSAVVAGATDAVFPLAGRALSLGGDVLKGLTGGLTGQGIDVIEAALSRPGAAFSAAGDASTKALGDLSSSVKTGVKNLTDKAGKEYSEKVASAGVQQIPRRFVVDGVKERLADLADGAVRNGKLVLENTPFTDMEERQLLKVFNVVDTWDDMTPAGINILARRINKFRRGAQDSANFDRVVDTLKREVRDFVGKAEPKIKEANELFGEKMDLIDEIDNVLKTNGKFQGREGVRKTAEALGRVFSSGKEFSREAIKDLEEATGMDILGTVAGIRLSDTAPRAASSLGDTAGNVIRPVASVASRNLVPLAGAVKNELIDRIAGIPGVSPSARASIVNTFAEFFRDEEE